MSDDHLETPATIDRARSFGSVAEAYDRAGHQLSQVRLEGVNGYDLTGRLLAWAAAGLAEGIGQAGALGPVQAFGLARLEEACRTVGLARPGA